VVVVAGLTLITAAVAPVLHK
jgi:hypothetical protein